MECGIYTITNIKDGKIYVGYSSNLNKRKQSHFWDLKNNVHQNNHLQNAINKYGIEFFVFEILEECIEEHLCALEHYWCNLLNTHNERYGYNILPTHPEGRYRQSEETKRKIGTANTGKKHSQETKDVIREYNRGNQNMKGKKHSLETKAIIKQLRSKQITTAETKLKMSNRRKGITLSGETREKMSQNQWKCRRVGKFDIEGNIIEEFISAAEAQRSIQSTCLFYHLQRNTLHKGYLWNYLN